MTVIGLEEHVVFPEVLEAWRELPAALQDLALVPATTGDTAWRLLDLGDRRLEAMDATGLDSAVLSLTTPGLQNLDPATAVPLQSAVNDRIADAVRSHPDRYEGFAALATTAPAAAAAELERAVTDLGLSGVMLYGRTGDRWLDHPDLLPVFEAAEALRVPVHLHPQTPPPAVRDAYYTGFGSAADAALATHALGWHYDAGVQVVRLILAGLFERFPRLQVVVGHWGEMALTYLDRVEHLTAAARLPRPVIETVRRNLYLAPSGMLNPASLTQAVATVGADRVLFSTDYPFEPAGYGGAARFLDRAPLTCSERDRIASGNWRRLTAAIHRRHGRAQATEGAPR